MDGRDAPRASAVDEIVKFQLISGVNVSSKPEGVAGERHFASLSAEPAEKDHPKSADRVGNRPT
jgi:hypothetical protein